MVEALRLARDDKNQQDDKNQSFAKAGYDRHLEPLGSPPYESIPE
jgi:hypothetical protein